MRDKEKENGHPIRFELGYLIPAAIMVVILMAPGLEAADYFVVGRVYSSTALAPGEDPPTNPLTGVSADQIIGEELVAGIPRNLVKVRVMDASNDSELASYITRQDGGYLASFTAAGASKSVRFIVEELATSKQLVYSEPNLVAAGVNVRFLLVNEALSDVSNDRDYAPAPSLPALYTAIFTRVGKVELATEVGGVTQHLIEPSTGLVNVPASVAADLAIPQYEDSPFGGNLYIFGAFSQALYSMPNVCYKIRAYPDPSDHSTFDYVDDALVKTKYTVNFVAGTVDTQRVTLGPKTVGGVTGCYELTPISPSNNVFWSFPDLVALWRTGGRNGDYELEFEFFGLPNPADFGLITDFSDMTLMLDNVAPMARILPLQAGDFDTPRVYTPGPAPGSDDLLGSLLGSFPTDYGGSADPTCLIFSLQPAAPTKYLSFKLTASHANSYLRSWHFRYERNDNNNEVLLGKKYDGVTNSMVDISGARVSSAQTSEGGFENMFLYLDANHLEPSGMMLGGCAYRFVVHAATRTTDGYHYLRRSWDQDLHFVQK